MGLILSHVGIILPCGAHVEPTRVMCGSKESCGANTAPCGVQTGHVGHRRAMSGLVDVSVPCEAHVVYISCRLRPHPWVLRTHIPLRMVSLSRCGARGHRIMLPVIHRAVQHVCACVSCAVQCHNSTCVRTMCRAVSWLSKVPRAASGVFAGQMVS